MYHLYIIYSPRFDRYYVGYTGNISTRLDKHNMGSTKSTRPYIPWELVYSEAYQSKTDAIKREREIKNKKSKKYIKSLIGGG